MTAEINDVPGTLEHLDPESLNLDDNVRDDAGLTKQFIASITENGVLVPIVGVRGLDGTVRVRTGQRRTLAAREAGLASVPVYVLDDDGTDNTVERVVEQIVENDHRAQLTPTQRVFGIQQLLDAGLSVTKTAKKLSRPASYVKDSQAVAASQQAIDALRESQVSLAEAAAIAEFDGDEHAVDRLLRAAGANYFEHEVGRLRAARAYAEQLARAEAGYAKAGYAVLHELPASFDPYAVPLHQLRLADGTDAGVADVRTPAQWAVLLSEDTVLTDKASGDLVDEDDVDWNTEGKPDSEPQEGLRHADTVVETTGFAPEYFCVDYAAAGLVPNERYMRLGGVSNFPGVQVDAEPVTAEELAAAQAAAADDKGEAERRERRKVLALNRLGEAALGVRREFVTRLLSRKSAPKGAGVFVARTLAADGYLLTNYKSEGITAALLGAKPRMVTDYIGTDGPLESGGVTGLIADLPGDGRAAVITLGLVLGALEARTPKDAWRESHGGQWSTRVAGPAQYLGFLAEQGYTLAPVEQIITGAASADEVYDQHLAEK